MTITRQVGADDRPQPDSYDVVVVGGRVAGAATAMLLARCGHRVLVVDRANAGSDTVSTHTILRLGLLQLKRWGLYDRVEDCGAPRLPEVRLGFGNEIVSIELSSDFGIDALYAPRRTVLDPILIEAAVEAGVEFRHRNRVVDLTWDGNRATGVVVDDGGDKQVIEARCVVGADGVFSKTADRVSAQTYRSIPAANATYYAYFKGVQTDHLHFHFAPGVTAGMIPTNGGETCIYMGWHSDHIGAFRADADAAFLDQAWAAHPVLGEAVAEGERVSRYRGTPGLPGFLRQPAGPGWALVGDAGYTKDNISAHGISDALRDAELCARAIDASLADPARERRYFSEYRVARDRLSVSILELSMELGGYRWDTARASWLMREIGNAVKEECEAMAALPPWRGVTTERSAILV
ncbi:MAG: NAD(P)/FAD-dependent oxidoreductase [Acidimicrobiia bacterium]|nr:NAD(P)/FAD-dependent oxidoreductase [Acidimicrobiia bacterium]